MSRYADAWMRPVWLVLFVNLVVVIPLLLGGLGALFFVLVIGAPLIVLFLAFYSEMDVYKKNTFKAPGTGTASDVSVAPEPPKDMQTVEMVHQPPPQPQMQYGQPGQQPVMMQPQQQMQYGQPGQQPVMMQPQQQMQYGQPGQQPVMIQPQQQMQYGQPGQQPVMMQPQQQMQYGQPAGQQPVMMQPQQQMQYGQPGQ